MAGGEAPRLKRFEPRLATLALACNNRGDPAPSWREMNRMLTLYDYGNSVCCQKVRLTLREKGLDWDAAGSIFFAASSMIPPT